MNLSIGGALLENLKNKKHKRAMKLALLAAILLVVAAYFAIPAVRSQITYIITLFTSASVESIVGYIRSYGPYAVAISFFLMVFQSVAAPLPAFLITFANAAVFGWWQGAILSWTSAMAGALLCFMIARIAGRDTVEKLTSKYAMESVDVYFDRYGKNTILICRLLPFVSFDFVSYAAGLTSMKLGGFLLATGVGQLPATIIYSYVGGMLTGSVKTVVTALLVIFALFALGFLCKKIYANRHREQAGE